MVREDLHGSWLRVWGTVCKANLFGVTLSSQRWIEELMMRSSALSDVVETLQQNVCGTLLREKIAMVFFFLIYSYKMDLWRLFIP
jgi:hypothetical protein